MLDEEIKDYLRFTTGGSHREVVTTRTVDPDLPGLGLQEVERFVILQELLTIRLQFGGPAQSLKMAFHSLLTMRVESQMVRSDCSTRLV